MASTLHVESAWSAHSGRGAPRHRLCRTLGATISEFVLPPSFMVPPHSHTPPHVLVMLSGEIVDVDDGAPACCPAGSLRYAPGGDHHQIRVSPRGAHCLVVEAAGFPELRLDHRVYVAPNDATLVRQTLTRWLLDAQFASPARVEDCALALFCRVRELERGERAAASWIADVQRMLDAPEPRTAPLADAARLAGRSSEFVARAFRAMHGVSIHRYYRRRQIDRAWELLARGESLSAIADRCGFADQSHMTRIFVRETGETPARLRAGLASGHRANWFLASPLRVVGD